MKNVRDYGVGIVAVLAMMGAAFSIWRQRGPTADSLDRPGTPLSISAPIGRPERRPAAAAARQTGGPDADQIIQVIPRDRIPAIFESQLVAADQAGIEPNAYVVGYARSGEAHAYALNLLNAHEIVNDVVGGQMIAATW